MASLECFEYKLSRGKNANLLFYRFLACHENRYLDHCVAPAIREPALLAPPVERAHIVRSGPISKDGEMAPANKSVVTWPIPSFHLRKRLPDTDCLPAHLSAASDELPVSTRCSASEHEHSWKGVWLSSVEVMARFFFIFFKIWKRYVVQTKRMNIKNIFFFNFHRNFKRKSITDVQK